MDWRFTIDESGMTDAESQPADPEESTDRRPAVIWHSDTPPAISESDASPSSPASRQSSGGSRQSMLPATIPIFPLPTVVLFPNVFLPLHIFEPRYREMVNDALEGDRIIGMVLLRPGWEGDYEGHPAVYPVGCAGLITNAQRHEDGRYNIVLRGLEKFRVVSEDRSRSYRLAQIETIMETVTGEERDLLRSERRRLEALLVPQPEGRGVDPKVPPSMADEDLVNTLAQYLDFEAVEKQALLERDGLLSRCRSLIELLEMKVIVSRHTWGEATN